ncbi:hypothetical protein D3C75_601120 [compost metagenome]
MPGVPANQRLGQGGLSGLGALQLKGRLRSQIVPIIAVRNRHILQRELLCQARNTLEGIILRCVGVRHIIVNVQEKGLGPVPVLQVMEGLGGGSRILMAMEAGIGIGSARVRSILAVFGDFEAMVTGGPAQMPFAKVGSLIPGLVEDPGDSPFPGVQHMANLIYPHLMRVFAGHPAGPGRGALCGGGDRSAEPDRSLRQPVQIGSQVAGVHASHGVGLLLVGGDHDNILQFQALPSGRGLHLYPSFPI